MTVYWYISSFFLFSILFFLNNVFINGTLAHLSLDGSKIWKNNDNSKSIIGTDNKRQRIFHVNKKPSMRFNNIRTFASKDEQHHGPSFSPNNDENDITKKSFLKRVEDMELIRPKWPPVSHQSSSSQSKEYRKSRSPRHLSSLNQPKSYVYDPRTNGSITKKNHAREKSSAPVWKETDFSEVSQLTIGPWFYALDMNPHAEFAPGFPGWSNTLNKRFHDNVISNLTDTYRTSKNFAEACAAIRNLAVIDGLYSQKVLDLEDFHHANQHLVAIFLEERTPNDEDRDVSNGYRARFCRLNRDGSWSFKDQFKAPKIVNNEHAYYHFNVVSVAAHLTTAMDFPSRFCDIMVVPDHIKSPA